MSVTPPSKDTLSLVRILAHHRVDVVLDVGANTGQYAGRLRDGGWAGRIVSFEPLPALHAALRAASAGDPAWRIAPALALGAEDGTVELNVSAESDMSSALPYRPAAAALLDSAAYTGSVRVPLHRLDGVFADHVAAQERPFLKIDTQGLEAAVLAGAAGIIDRLIGIQVELAIVPIYEGEPGWQEMTGRLQAAGFDPVLFIPGYFNRRTARLMSMDGVFVRRDLLPPS